MTYFSQAGAMHGWNGRNGYVPPAPITKIVCDPCAKAGAVPFEMRRDWRGRFKYRMQARPWKWAPWRGGCPCDACGKDC